MTEERRGKAPSRRDVFRLAGSAPVLAAAGGIAQAQQVSPRRREALETLSAAEADALEAVCARLIPTDGNGPGAREARAAHYIDRALGSALASSRESYRTGLAELDRFAVSGHGHPFASLTSEMQDALLMEFEKSNAVFFNLVRQHTLQGTFCDPYYGGNANFVGWDMIGYPGIRLAVPQTAQAMEPHLTPVRKSAYDFAMFDRHGAVAAEHHPAPVDRAHMPNGMGDMKNDN